MPNNFKVGDKVRYVGKHTAYPEKSRIGQTGVVVDGRFSSANVPVLWDHTGKQQGVYPENIEAITEPKAGDRVRVTYEGEVTDIPSPGVVGVRVKGEVTYLYTRIADVEVLEPSYEAGTVVKDAQGVPYVRSSTGWWSYGTAKHFDHDYPKRPLRVLTEGEK